MKTKFRKLTSIFLAVIMAFSVFTIAPITASAYVSAYYFSDDFYYIVNLYGYGTAVITDYTGSATELEIPSELNGYTVTSIREKAFYECTSLESVTIGNSVTRIGKHAFYGCTNLESLTIGNSLTSIGEHAFSNCTSLSEINVSNNNPNYCIIDGILYNKNKTEIIKCPSVKTEVNIPNSVKSIGYAAFDICQSIESITIPDSVTSIDAWAFNNCSNLMNVTIGNSVTSIGESAFDSCPSLESITIPESVEVIDNYAFNTCVNLWDITIPDSVTYIGKYVFHFTAWFDEQPEGVVYIGNYVYFYKGNNIEYVTIKDGTKGIASKAFVDCGSLKGVEIPDSVTFIGDSAFSECDNFESITIPDSVTSIGEWAFSNCSILKSITIPDSVTSIGESAFSGTPWYGNQPHGLVYIGKFSLGYKGSMSSNTTISLRSNTKGIADSAFSGNSFKNLKIPGSVTFIGKGAFSGCTNLTNATIENGVKEIRTEAFYSCTSLTSITIPDSVTSIGDYAFGYYYDDVKEERYKIDGFTIYGYTGSEAETYANENGFTFVSSGDAPATTPSTTVPSTTVPTTTVPSTTVPSTTVPPATEPTTEPVSHTDFNYKVNSDGTAVITGYKGSDSNVIIPNVINGCTVTSIGNVAFSECTNLTSVTIGNGVTSIGEYAFCDCTNLASVTIGNSVKSISDYAFYTCENLKSVTIPESVTSIGTKAFGYMWHDGLNDIVKIEGFTIQGYEGTTAETYAKDNSFAFVNLNDEPTPMLGDVDGDKELTVKDATEIQKYIVEITKFDDEQIKLADVDGDKDITVKDATYIQKIIVELI